MKFYLAASFADRERMLDVEFELENRGHEVTSQWLHQEEAPADETLMNENPEQAVAYAQKDMGDIYQSDIVAVFTDVPSTTGAFHTEFGMAIGLDKPICLVGSAVTVFMTLPSIRKFPNVDAFLAFAENATFNFGVLQEG